MQHFNQLTPAQAELLALLAEECGECVQAIGKILRHGFDSRNPLVPGSPSNLNSLEREMGDIRAAIVLLCELGPASEVRVAESEQRKLQKGGRWLHHQQAPSLDRDHDKMDNPAGSQA